MLELQYLREHREEIRAALAKKKFPVDLEEFFRLDEERRAKTTAYESARAELKSASEGLASLDRSSPEFAERTGQLRNRSERAKELESALKEVEVLWERAYLAIPNVPHESVPIGRSERDNVTISSWGDPNAVSPHAIPHFDIPWIDRALDFARGVKVTGAGFPFYVGPMAQLVRALVRFFLDCAAERGYEEFLPPILVNAASATATGQLPDKESMMYEMPLDGFYAVPTAEVPVTNFFRDEILEESQLPIFRCAYTPCFRREAGSWGKDVRGLNRLHQFDKVELVKWVRPDRSFAELESLRADAERILQLLEIPFRVLAICAGDMGFPHSKQYDLEVWAGGQRRWLEVSSCSNFTDFQARRANIRYRPRSGKKPEPVHTLNGSGLAVPRVLVAILENNLRADGSVSIPVALQPYLKFDRLFMG
ncbi:MAG: serine--tRNA ligase [Puniceicoccales bacterium]|jgi:seryl-tRNA synthetase|nr:serine--tRNA ligase [Puniceicoccales bacterium]